jgi:hypothetical protein
MCGVGTVGSKIGRSIIVGGHGSKITQKDAGEIYQAHLYIVFFFKIFPQIPQKGCTFVSKMTQINSYKMQLLM